MYLHFYLYIHSQLALASQDKTMTLSDEKGNSLLYTTLKYDPEDLQFAEQKVRSKEDSYQTTQGYVIQHTTFNTQHSVS